MLKYAAILGFCLLLLGCSGQTEYANSPQFNSTTGQFEHPEGDRHDKSLSDFLGLASAYFGREPDAREDTGFEVIQSDKDVLADFSENLIWIGQSTVLLNHQGTTILTDPQFSNRASPFSFIGPKRVTPVPFGIEDLPDIDLVIISHNHYDHLDRHSITALAELQPDISFFVPLGLAEQVRGWGVKTVIELDWWQSASYAGIDIQPTPLQHWSKRSLFDRNQSLWAGWMLRWQDFSFYFAGDTGYSDDFSQIARRLGSPTLAAIPIGAYAPRAFMKSAHLNPEEAVRVFEDLGAEFGLGIHWGTFKLTLEKMDEPPARLQAGLNARNIEDGRFRTLKHGESWRQPFMK